MLIAVCHIIFTQPKLPGMGIENLFTLRTVEDTLKIKEYIDKHNPKSAVLAGGGFIGLELAENLSELGIEVSIFTAYNFAEGYRFYDAVIRDKELTETSYACGMDK